MANNLQSSRFPFWARLLEMLVEVISAAEKVRHLTDGRSKKTYALDLVDRWYRDFGLRIPFVPRFLERRILRKIASDLIDALVAFLDDTPPRAKARLR